MSAAVPKRLPKELEKVCARGAQFHSFCSCLWAEIQADKRSPDSGHFCVGQSRKSLTGEFLAHFAGFPVLNFGLQWKCIIEGPAGTPYEGGNFMFELTFPPEYPFHSPKCVLIDCCCSVERDQLTCDFAVKSLTKVRKSRAFMKLPCRHTNQLNVRFVFYRFCTSTSVQAAKFAPHC
jgi:hypothetical protein